MDLVVDANIIIAALISPQGHTSDLFFLDTLNIYAPEFLLREVKKYKGVMTEKTGLAEEELDRAILFLSQRIKFLPSLELNSFFPEAEKISPDPNDVIYFALALKLRCPLWSNDKLLKKQSEVKVLSTAELIQLLS